MTLDNLQNDLDAASAAVDARLKRDAETIRRLVEELKGEAFIDTERHSAAPIGHEWKAWQSGYEETCGTGPTEAAAILDLLER